MTKSKKERIALLFSKLKDADCVSSAQLALDLLGSTLDYIEDKYSGIPKEQNPSLEYKGRIYAPKKDNIVVKENGNIEAVTKGEIIIFGKYGSIDVFTKKHRELLFHKDGCN